MKCGETSVQQSHCQDNKNKRCFLVNKKRECLYFPTTLPKIADSPTRWKYYRPTTIVVEMSMEKIGQIYWLPFMEGGFPGYGISESASDHPCVVLDVTKKADLQSDICHICIVSTLRYCCVFHAYSRRSRRSAAQVSQIFEKQELKLKELVFTFPFTQILPFTIPLLHKSHSTVIWNSENLVMSTNEMFMAYHSEYWRSFGIMSLH